MNSPQSNTQHGWPRAALALALATTLAATGCNADGEAAPDGGQAQAQEVKPMAVEIRTIEAQQFVQTFEFPGVAQPIEELRVAAESAGRVLAAPVVEGERVEKGDLVLRVDAKSSSAQINLLKAQVSSARREYNRIKQLAGEGLATPQQLDQSTSQLEQAQLGLKQARVGKAMSTVRSPFTGVVARKYVDEGEFTSPGQPIADIVDTSTIKIEVTVPESAIRYVRVGDEVAVDFPASDIEVTGKITRRGVVVAQPTQTFPVEIHVPNPNGELIPGMRARVVVPKLTLEDAIVVPRDALLEGVYQREAMVARGLADGLGEAELRVVTISESRGNEVVVDSGLKVGDRLIVVGHRNVVDGTPVRVVREQKDDRPAAPAPAADDAAAAPAPDEDDAAAVAKEGSK